MWLYKMSFENADALASILGFEPVRLADVEGIGGQIEIDGALRDVMVRRYNYSADVGGGLDEDQENSLVLSLVSIYSYPSTKDSDPYCEVTFRVWTDRPSAGFLLQRALEANKDAFVITHYPPNSVNGDDVETVRRIRVVFDAVEMLPFDLDHRENTQALERVRLKNARYELVQDPT